MSEIIRYRGDTRALLRYVKQGGVAVDITSWAFTLTIDTRENPDDDSTKVEAITGTIVSGVGGSVSFAFPDTLAAGVYYYDIQATDASAAVTTLEKGRLTLLQDITK